MVATVEFEEAKSTLIEAWGTLGNSWGINKAMAKIHILLLISPDPLSTEDIMEELSISRGNANLNIRALIDWGLVFKKLVPGERKEYFYPVKEMWELVRIVATERRKREIQPVTKVLDEVSRIDPEGDPAKEEFLKTVHGMIGLVDNCNMAVDQLIKIEKSKFLRAMISLS
jgi:DNA-binding transcriptional regulator GbsR (MarR family)